MVKPGSNEITIHGITPTADENSIKVEGTGAAIITDMTIDLEDNHEIFDDVYPSDSEDEGSLKSDDSSESDDESQAVKDLSAQIRKVGVPSIAMIPSMFVTCSSARASFEDQSFTNVISCNV